jgi:hypothetical protein
VDEKLQASAPTTIKPTLEQQDVLPNAPSSTKEPSLQGLGFPANVTQANAKEQAAARQAHTHGEDPSTDGINHHDSLSCGDL